MIGVLIWLVWKGAMFLFPPLVTGMITLVAWIAWTGGLHLDGLADCCDGLLASVPAERRLEIMRDPHLGAFGVSGVVMVLLLKAAALASLTSETSFGILLAATLARWCILPAGLFPNARLDGLGADFSLGLQRSFIYVAGVLPMVLAFVLEVQGIVSLLAGVGATLLILQLAKSRIGGVTGDVLGMIVEVVEMVVLLVFAIKSLGEL
jgi:adenosylcobinamide-GDP ribazoletransferase